MTYKGWEILKEDWKDVISNWRSEKKSEARRAAAWPQKTQNKDRQSLRPETEDLCAYCGKGKSPE